MLRSASIELNHKKFIRTTRSRQLSASRTNSCFKPTEMRLTSTYKGTIDVCGVVDRYGDAWESGSNETTIQRWGVTLCEADWLALISWGSSYEPITKHRILWRHSDHCDHGHGSLRKPGKRISQISQYSSGTAFSLPYWDPPYIVTYLAALACCIWKSQYCWCHLDNKTPLVAGAEYPKSWLSFSCNSNITKSAWIVFLKYYSRPNIKVMHASMSVNQITAHPHKCISRYTR